MIRNYNLGTALSELAKPTAIGKGYFHNNDTGFTLDYLYGPYDTPENGGLLQFTYEDEDENTITRPNANIDGPSGEDGVWHIEDGTPVYNTRLDYQKALAEQLLTDMKQFFIGKKVAFITNEGKAKEYVVVPVPNTDPVELEFEDSDLVDIYTVKFMTINGSGAQADVETVTKFYTLPQSLFIPPKETLDDKTIDQLFEGWYFGYMAGGQLVIDEDTLYHVGQSVNLQALCEHANITDRTVTFYAKYMEHDSVLVDFENGYYKPNGDFVNLDGKGTIDGYLKVQDGLSANNTKPDDWDNAYSSYFTRIQSNYGRYVRTTYNWVHNHGYTVMEWNESNFNTYFPQGYYDNDPTKALCPYSYTSTMAPYFIAYVHEDHWGGMWWTDRYYKFQTNPTNSWKYIPCTSNYEMYKDSDLFTHVVKDSIAIFNNGLLLGDVMYDCMNNTTPQAYQGLLAQLNTYISYSYYSDRFEFDRWEITPKKITDSGSWETDPTMNPWTEEHLNATIALDSTYEYATSEETVTFPADAYVFRAVYRKRDDYYYRLHLETNYGASGDPSGEIQITCKYKMLRRPNQLGIYTVGTYDKNGYHLDSSLNNSQSIQLGVDCIEFDPYIIKYITITAVPDTTTPASIAYCWTGDTHQIGAAIEDIPVESGITRNYKAWFVFEGDANATVKVGKRLSTPTPGNLVTKFNGSTVGVYDWKLMDNNSNQPISGHTITSMGYIYEESHIVDDSLVPVLHQDLTFNGTLDGPNPSSNNNNGRWQKVIDEASPLSNPAIIEIDETGHGYCFIKATESANGARFIKWSDGDTNPIKLVDVTIPTLYSFTAIFQGVPLNMSDVADYADLAMMDYSSIVVTPYSHVNNNREVGQLSREITNNTVSIPIPETNEYIFANVPMVKVLDNPESIAEYNNLTETIRNTVQTAQNLDVTVTYDYNGTQYKETLVETGKSVTLEN